MSYTRRSFVSSAALGFLGASNVSALASGSPTKSQISMNQVGKAGSANIIVCAGNGYAYLERAYQYLLKGGDTLDAAIEVVRGPEDDPEDDSVGLGGLPNEEGVVELDASCMHGPTRRAGSVGGVRNIRSVAALAKEVMNHTGHVMLVGEGAERFAVARGFKRENLLTEETRKVWLLWKESHADWWGPGLADPSWRKRLKQGADGRTGHENIDKLYAIAEGLQIAPERRMAAIERVLFPPTGTIHCSVLNQKGEMSGCTTTSGLAWKLPGRVGDSPIIGAGCYTDQDVGSAGATGSGEENIKVAGAHNIIECMRRGATPFEAGMETLKRIVRNYNNDMDRIRYLDMTYYILRKDGAYAGVSMWTGYEPNRPHLIAVHDGKLRAEKTVSMFEGASEEWPPIVENSKQQI